MESKETYIQKLESLLKELTTKIEALKVQASLAKAEVRDEYNRQIEIIHARLATTRKKLQEVHDAGEEVWEELKFGMDNALDDLKESLKKAVDKLK